MRGAPGFDWECSDQELSIYPPIGGCGFSRLRLCVAERSCHPALPAPNPLAHVHVKQVSLPASRISSQPGNMHDNRNPGSETMPSMTSDGDLCDTMGTASVPTTRRSTDNSTRERETPPLH